MSWTERPVTPQPWKLGLGCISAEKGPNDTTPSIEDRGYYGGALVCESISEADQQFILVAIRQRDILWAALHAIGQHCNDTIKEQVRTAFQLCTDAEYNACGPEAFTARAIAAFLQEVRGWWWREAYLLPEYATRARVEEPMPGY